MVARRIVVALIVALLALGGCGVRSGELHQGDAAPAGVAALVTSDATDKGLYAAQFCGGALIAPTVVLTAGHCVKDKEAKDIDVLLGAKTICGGGDGTRYHLHQVIMGPDGSDTAALILTTPTQYAPLPLVAAVPAFPFTATAYGWGDLDKVRPGTCRIKAVSLEFQELSACDNAAKFDTPTDPAYDLCARPEHGSALNTCSGDSGGPALVPGDGGPELIGLTDWGASCSRFAHGGYNNIVALAPWFTPIVRAAAATPSPGTTLSTSTTANSSPTWLAAS